MTDISRLARWLGDSSLIRLDYTFTKDGEQIGKESFHVATNHANSVDNLVRIVSERSVILAAHPENSLHVKVDPTWFDPAYADPSAKILFIEFLDAERYRFQGEMTAREASAALAETEAA